MKKKLKSYVSYEETKNERDKAGRNVGGGRSVGL